MKTFYPLLPLIFFLLIFSSGSQAQDDISVLKGTHTIAFVADETGHAGIYSNDKSGQTTIKSTAVKGGYLAWSPDGKQLAFYAKYDERKTWSIHTMNVDGTNRQRLTHAKNKWDYAPEWSPDGKHIYFSREYKDADNVKQAEIWMMNVDGSGKSQIKSLRGGSPFFTPDGRILFHSLFKDKNSEISIADKDGSNIIQLTDNEANEWHPDISPDGKHIAFMSDRDGNYEIYVMNIDGSDQTRLTFNEGRDSMPSWSPDGSKILFSSRDVDGDNKHIYVMNKDGSSVAKIIPNSSGAVFQR